MKIFKHFPVLSCIILIFFMACSSEPEEMQEPIQEEIEPVVIDETEPVEEEIFEVTQEIYDKTFHEINELIKHLDGIIAKKNYIEWESNLSDSYILTYSDKELLLEKSESPILEMNDIVLESLKDYFKYVVVPSRMSLELEEIDFDDESHVTAWTIFNNNKTKLYQLELIDGSWKISIW
jgi:hypothetical protein